MEDNEVVWKRGQFYTFYAKMKMRVGGATPFDILEGDEFQYDGMTVKYSGMEVPQQGLRSAHREGWYTLVENDVGTRVEPIVPSRNVAKSQTINRDLAHVQRTGGRPMEADHADEDTILNVSDRRPGADKNMRAQPRVMTKDDNQRRQPRVAPRLIINPGTIEAQEYAPVGRIRTSAKLKVDMTKAESSYAKQELDNLRGSGFIPDNPPPSRGHTIEREGVTIRTNVSKMDRNAPAEIAQEDEGEFVAPVRHTSRGSGNAEGVSVRDTSNIRAERAAAANGKHEKASSKDVKIDTKLNPKIRMARRIDPTFPSDWSFTGKLKDRMDAVKKHGASQEFLEALYAAEGDQMRKLLEKTYPKQFGG